MQVKRGYMKKKLLSYEKGKFDDFVKSLPCSEQDVFSISYLTNENIALKSG